MNWRRIILIGLIVLFSIVVLTHFVAATELVSTLQRGQPLWVMVALALELLWLLNQTALYQSLYVLMQLPAYMSQMLPIVLASNFINFAAPSACLGGIALFLNDARLRGLKASRVMLVNLLFMVFNLAFFAILLVFGLIMLHIWHDLKLYQLLGGAILLTNVGLLAGGLLLAGAQPKGVVCLLNTSSSIVNRLGRRLFKRNLLSERKVLRFALEFSEAAAAVRRAKQQLGRPLLHALLITLLDMSVLYACLVAFPSGGTPISMTVLMTGYSRGSVVYVPVDYTTGVRGSGWSYGCYIRQPSSANSQSHCCCASLSRIELLVAPAQWVRCHTLGQIFKSVSGVT